MRVQVKLACQGTAVDRHPRKNLATYEYSAVTGWQRKERWADDNDVRYLPGSEGWAANTPGARSKERCRTCGRTPELTWDELTAKLDSAMLAGEGKVVL